MPNPLGRNPLIRDVRDYDIDKLVATLKVPLSRKVVSILDQARMEPASPLAFSGRSTVPRYAKFTSADIVPFFLQIPGHGALPDGGAQIRDGLKTAQSLAT